MNMTSHAAISIKAVFYLGSDFGQYRLPMPDISKLNGSGEHFKKGYDYGKSLIKRNANKYVKKWLSVRLRSLAKNLECTITPDDLKAAYNKTGGKCPILKMDFTFAEQSPLDWSVERIDVNKGYEPGNIAIISAFVNQVRNRHDFYALCKEFADRMVCENLANAHMWNNLIAFYAGLLNHDRIEAGKLLINDSTSNIVLGWFIHDIANRDTKAATYLFMKKYLFRSSKDFETFCKKARKQFFNICRIKGEYNAAYDWLSKHQAFTDNALNYLKMKHGHTALLFYNTFCNTKHLNKTKLKYALPYIDINIENTNFAI